MSRFLSFRVAPGVRLSASRRGVRAHVGPRLARVHVGGGRTGLSTGAGPLTYYSSGSRSRSRTSGRRPSEAQAQKMAAHDALADQLQGLMTAHRQEFDAAQRSVAGEPKLPKYRVVLAAAEKKELRGAGWFDRSSRREARSRARTLADQWALDLLTRSRQDRARIQAGYDAHWSELTSNSPTAVTAAVSERFRASGRAAGLVSVVGDCAQLDVAVAGVEASVPDSKPAVTPSGNATVHKATKTDRAEWYRQYVAGQMLLAAKDCLAAAPGLRRARVVASYDGRPLVAGDLTRDALAVADWSHSPWDVLKDADPRLQFDERGRARELHEIDRGRVGLA